MSHLLDTNILSAHLRRPRGLLHRFVQHAGNMYVSTISVAELHVWARRASAPDARLKAISHLLRYEVASIPFDENTAMTFGIVQTTLRSRGHVVQDVDLFIACTALAHDLTLVTHNVKHFAMIDSLRLLDWLED